MKKNYITPTVKFFFFEQELLEVSDWKVDDEVVDGQGAKAAGIDDDVEDSGQGYNATRSVWDD